ncbi:polyprenyl synthetase family protein [Sporichthya sp.]|uniref:polyprenyl synthetase family protein n=1 Tax=Sporichthya sp. TaxID=65475 RepID=UPI0017C44EA0|nr:polyprenyl synthetase family protein [Sporichthya sp.]MBA3745577.1 polyprenyl synthetase family protein [Sporichthya sp.]
MTSAEPDPAHLRERVQGRLTGFLTDRGRAVAELGPELAAPMTVLADLTVGGKLLRPAFCYWGYRAAGAPDGEEIVTAAAALELLHVSALIHDDVMDDSDRRRGRPSAHRQFTELHRSAGWAGSAEGFGHGAAILLGDLVLGWADELLRSCGLPAERVAAAMAVFEAMRTEVMGGQYLDLVAQAAGDDDALARAMRVLRFKTAKYSVERPLQLGATLAGGSFALVQAFTAVGIPLGEAFQLRDDVLGVFGDPERTGKPAGDDLREGKRTVLVTTALATADTADRATMDALLGNPHLDANGVARLRSILVASGALDEVEKLIERLAAEAEDALAAAPIEDPTARQVLADLVVAATQRHE